MVNLKKFHFFVAGFPIRHSLSPQFFHFLSVKTGVDLHYVRLATEQPEDVVCLLNTGFDGGNITMPLKEKICQLPFKKTPIVELIQAANLIYRKDDQWYMENTDIIGVRESLRPYEKEIRNQPALVIGAGGAGRAAVVALREYTNDITLTNRTHESASWWSKKLSTHLVPFDDINNVVSRFKVIVYTIPTEIPLKITSDQIFLEARYDQTFFHDTTPHYIGGLNWLIHQALPSFELLTSRKIEVSLFAKFLDTFNSNLKKERGKKHQNTEKNIFLIGFMKSGKTTVGRLTAEQLGVTFIDLDEHIEKKHKQSVSDIIKQKGLIYFRNFESRTLREIFKENSHNVIIATGGGIVERKVNRDFLRKHGYVIFLSATMEELKKRSDNSERPLWKDNVENLFEKRIRLYKEAADEIIVTNGKSVDEVIRYVVGR